MRGIAGAQQFFVEYMFEGDGAVQVGHPQSCSEELTFGGKSKELFLGRWGSGRGMGRGGW